VQCLGPTPTLIQACQKVDIAPLCCQRSIYTDCANVDVAGSGSVSVNVNKSVMIDVRCKYALTLKLPAAVAVVAADGGGNNASRSVVVDSVVFVPDYKHSNAYADAGTSK